MVMDLRHRLVGAALLVAALAGSQAAYGQQAAPGATDSARDTNLRAYAELLRSDIRAQKVAIITQLMEFSSDEDAKFWPVYREYETELAGINDARLALIEEYAAKYASLDDATADRLARGALDVEARRNALKAKYYDRFASVVPPRTAARFLQIENQILLLLDLQIAASLPVVD